MKKLHLFWVIGLIATTIFFLPSCEEDKATETTSDVEIRFRAILDAKPYVMNERFMYGEREMSISALRFFISDLVLTQGDLGAEVTEIELVDFEQTNTNEESAEIGFTIAASDLPKGNYDGVKFGIGVPSDLNAQDPSVYGADHPLRNTSDYWADWGSYIFTKVEGRYNNDDNEQDLEAGFNYHIGGDPFFREKEFNNMNITIEDGAAEVIVIDIDIREIMKAEDGELLDLPNIGNNGNVHTMPSQESIAGTIADNWKEAFVLD